jgi:hypothetical protein
MQEDLKTPFSNINDWSAWKECEIDHDIYIRQQIASIFPEKTIYFASDYPDPNFDYSNQISVRDPVILTIPRFQPRHVFQEIKYMKKEHLQEVKDRKAFLVCEYYKECSASYMNWMYVKCIASGIPTEQVIIVSSSIDFKKHSEIFANIYKVKPIDVIYYCFYARLTKREILVDSDITAISNINCDLKTLEDLVPLSKVKSPDPLNFNNFKKRFIFLNHMPRPQRALMTILLNAYDLLDHGYVSYLSSNKELFELKFENTSKLFTDYEQFKKGIEIKNQIPLYVDEWLKEYAPKNISKNYTKKLVPTLPSGIDPAGKGFLTLHEYINHSFCNLVSERYFNSNSKKSFENEMQAIFITEKTFKSIAFKQPFILMSLPGSLEVLKKLGYKTFSPYIDESYDLIEDSLDRMLKIVLEIKRICELDENTLEEYRKKLIPIVEHNFNLLMTRKDFLHYPC